MLIVLALLTSGQATTFAESAESADAAGAKDVLVYPTLEEGSIMHWLAISPLQYDIRFLGDSMSAPLFPDELALRPRSGDRVQGEAWRKMHFPASVNGPSMADLFLVANHGFDYAATCCCAYIYSPAAHPQAIFAGSADDALKVVFNHKLVWTNQIQRSPTYDSDQCAAPLAQGWNTVLATVDQVIGGHIICARFLDGGKPITDLEISLDPPASDAIRHPADVYNHEASDLLRGADQKRYDAHFAEAVKAYGEVIATYPLADVAARAAYGKATTLFDPAGAKSLGDAPAAAAALEQLLRMYPQDLLAEYALLDLGRIQEQALKDRAKAEATYRSFAERYGASSLAPRSVVSLARLLAEDGAFEDSILAYRKAISTYPQSDEVMDATVGMGDTWRLAGAADKAKAQYAAAAAMAQDWHDNRYGIDVGKQAWLSGILDYLRQHGATP